MLKGKSNPRYDFTNYELKIMRALWLKNAPMSYEEILGACLSDYWHETYAPHSLERLLSMGVVKRLENGKYDRVLTPDEYQKYEKRKKARERFHEFFSTRPVWEGCFHERGITEYHLRELEEMVRKGRR